ncbi:GPW/gp25 family protein [uncultured Mitsuokella sp.]|uniref:GPW/gp25 family protein n=1 Tax=uncultured Mitsuokella sp. TaxID=453120 RepID=UPI0025996D25|nr:GPW/gp25 family protein [uncultured Mitsuokella sp.]
MSYLLTANQKPAIDLDPKTTVEEVLQNVRTIITTIKYEIPLDRDFGIDGDVIDMPTQQAQAKLSQEIFRAVRQYEPRAVIESIDFSGDESGKLIPKLEVSISEAS